MNDYNPFANDDNAGSAARTDGGGFDNPPPANNAPANQFDYDYDTDSAAPKSYTSPRSGGGKAAFTDPITGVPLTEADLRAREEALERREREIELREQQLADGTYVAPKDAKNFPPLLHLWAYHPDDDIPENFRVLVKRIFWIYCSCAIVYLLNFIGALGCLKGEAAKKTSSPATMIVMSIIYLVVLIPVSFEVSFFVMYSAVKEGKGLRLFCFMVTYFIWFAFLVLNLIGINGNGTLGYIITFDLFGAAKGVAIIGLLFCITGTLVAVAMVFTFIHLIKLWKSEGLEKKAFQEASKIAAEKAYENKDTIIETARENPELVANAAQMASQQRYG